MTTQQHEFLWFKIHTTGLDPREEALLEFAVVLAADGIEGDMSVVDAFTSALHHETPERIIRDPGVLKMHTDSGLIAACKESDKTVDGVDRFLVLLCQSLTPGKKPRNIVLAGANPAFEMRWIEHCLPGFRACLSPHSLSITGLQRAATAWLKGYERKFPPRGRALDELKGTLEIAQRWRVALELEACPLHPDQMR